MNLTQRNLVARTIELIYHNLDAPLSVPELATRMSVSESVLKRAFADVVGTPPATLARRLRLELAFRSLRSRELSVLETTLASGFSDHAAFSRSFRRAFGFAPVAARSVANLVHELESCELAEPDIVELEALQLQATLVRAPYFVSAPRAWQELAAALEALPEDQTEQAVFVGLALDDPHAPGGVHTDEVRFCAGVVGIARDLGLDRIATHPGTYARFRYSGKLANMGLAYHHIYGAWRQQAAQDGLAIRTDPALILFERLPSQISSQVTIAVPLESETRS